MFQESRKKYGGRNTNRIETSLRGPRPGMKSVFEESLYANRRERWIRTSPLNYLATGCGSFPGATNRPRYPPPSHHPGNLGSVLTRLYMKVKLVPRHLNQLDVSPPRERTFPPPPSGVNSLPGATLRFISLVKSDGQWRIYECDSVYTLFTRNRITFSVPLFCFSLHLPHSVSNASGRCSERITTGIQIRDVFCDEVQRPRQARNRL